jgi:colicin import membrane protein
MVRSSGIPAFDVAVERAIRRCDPFPRPKDGPMPRSLPLIFDPVDAK